MRLTEAQMRELGKAMTTPGIDAYATVARMMAEMWSEGYQDGWSDRAHPGEDVTRNPYRTG